MRAKGLPDGSGIDVREAVAAYKIALDGVSHTAVVETTRRFLAGLISRNNHSFMPNAPEFAVAARLIDRELGADLTRLMDEKRTLDELREKATRERSTPEQIERIREIHAAFRAQYEADKDRETKAETATLDEERAERMRAILAMPLRAGASAEEMENARKMAVRLSA